MNIELKYRTFDDLLNEVYTDLYVYNTEAMIDPAQLIKVAQKVNYELGIRIHKTKHKVLDLAYGKARLPDDFYVLNYAFLCGDYKVVTPALSGRHTENVEVETVCNTCAQLEPACTCERTTVDETLEYYKVVQKLTYETRVYESFEPLQISGSRKHRPGDGYHAEIKDGFIISKALNNARVYINYEGALEDDQGNLLVIDHPMLNEYYEYALKQRILENLLMNGEDVDKKLQLVEARIRPARNNALSLVNTPNFSDMLEVYKGNRMAMANRYYNMFKSRP